MNKPQRLGLLVPNTLCTIRAGKHREYPSSVVIHEAPFCVRIAPQELFTIAEWLKYVHPNRWDEWVPSNRLLKFNDANVAHQKSLQASQPGHGSASAAAGKAHKASAAGASARGVARKDGARGTKRGRDEVRPGAAALSGRLANHEPGRMMGQGDPR